jgi:hypothetical protein
MRGICMRNRSPRVQVAGVSYLRADYSLSCDTTEWTRYAIWAVFAGFLYIAGTSDLPTRFIACLLAHACERVGTAVW